jgi:hypothetical protein
MKISKIEGIAGIAALVLAMASLSAPAYADSSAGSAPANSPWVSMASQAWVNYTGIVPVLTATFNNQSPSLVNATAYATFHNLIGQTVAMESVAMAGLNPGQNATIGFYLTAPLDVYTVDLFVVSSSGTAISAVTNSTIVA